MLYRCVPCTHTHCALWCVTDTPLCWEKCLSMPGNNILGVRAVPQISILFPNQQHKGLLALGTSSPTARLWWKAKPNSCRGTTPSSSRHWYPSTCYTRTVKFLQLAHEFSINHCSHSSHFKLLHTVLAEYNKGELIPTSSQFLSLDKSSSTPASTAIHPQ